MLLGVSFYILIYYAHPDDRNTSYGPKIIVVTCFTLCEISVMFVALDVANKAGIPGCGIWNNFCGGLVLSTAWQALFGIIFAFVALIIPFATFFYEANEQGRKLKSRLCEALQYQGIALVISGIILGLMFGLIDEFSFTVPTMPIVTTQFSSGAVCPFTTPAPTAAPTTLNGTAGNTTRALSECYTVAINSTAGVITNVLVINPMNNTWVVSTSLPTGGASLVRTFNLSALLVVPNTFWVYLACMMSFVGWFLFAVFTGVGLVTLPIDLCKAYKNRPKYIPKDVYIKLRDDLKRRTNELLDMGTKMKEDRKRFADNYSNTGYRERYNKGSAHRTAFKEFKLEVEMVEEDFDDLRICHEAFKSYNPLVPYCKLVGGILGGLLSLAWLAHIVLFIVIRLPPEGYSYPNGPPVTYFLNTLIALGLNCGFSLVGVVMIGVFGLYLFFCSISGNFKIGLRFLIIEIHPMKVGATYMSSFMVNVLLLMLQVPALLQFMAVAFVQVVTLTDIDTIMNRSVRYTTFFVWFFEYNIFPILLLFFSVLAMLMLYVFPNDRDARSAKRLRGRIEKLQTDIEKKELQAAKKPKGIGQAGSAFARYKASNNGAGVDAVADDPAATATAAFASTATSGVDPSRAGLGLK